jgi:hypothetical protein
LNNLIKDPVTFAGSAIEQTREVTEAIKQITKGEITKVELQSLI